jgi:4-hydroxybenzoate polyprenyltransferase
MSSTVSDTAFGKARLFANLIKVEHTIFALPFAYVGAFLAVDGVPSAHDLLWITIAMAGARSLAMALNRLIDAGIDARNPRTATENPSGKADDRAVFLLAGVAGRVPVAVWQLNGRALALADPGDLFVVYPYLSASRGSASGSGRSTVLPRWGMGCDHGDCPGRHGPSAAPSRPG